MADKEALAVYLRRMREHGWDVSPTIRKALQCGASIMPEVRPWWVCYADALDPAGGCTASTLHVSSQQRPRLPPWMWCSCLLGSFGPVMSSLLRHMRSVRL